MKRIIVIATTVLTFAGLTGLAWAADKEGASNTGLILVALLPFLFIYFIPAIIGYSRKKDNKTSILLLNLFLGWSLIGWVVALIWATSKDKVTVQHIYVQQTPPAAPVD
ncbi:MAG: superinfection immunity protein [Proteobacteria bacterium]|nr:superinfection immunity protein [Pseudomonadota bacterium]